MTTFEIVKELSKQKHMTLAQVNDKAGLGTNSIYSWKTSKPGMENLQKVAKVLHTSTDYLLGNTDDPSPAKNKSTNEDDDGLSWQDFGMAYGGRIPDELKSMYRAIAEDYVKRHPEALKKSLEEEDDDLDD